MTIMNKIISNKLQIWLGIFFLACVPPVFGGELLKVKTEIIDQKYCIDTSVSNSKFVSNKSIEQIPGGEIIQSVRIKLTLSNISSKPIIIQKDYLSVPYSVIAISLKDFKKEKYISEVSSFFTLQFNTLGESSPPSEKFVILMPSEVFSTEFDDLIYQNDLKTKMNEGNYYLGYSIVIWGGQVWAGKEIRERWKDFGYLWTDSIFTGPILLTVAKPKTIDKCSN